MGLIHSASRSAFCPVSPVRHNDSWAIIQDTAMSIWLIDCCFWLPFSVGEVHEVHVQPLLNRRSLTLDSSIPPSPTTPLSPRSPSTPAFFDDLGSLDPSLYTTIAEVGLTEMGVGVFPRPWFITNYCTCAKVPSKVINCKRFPFSTVIGKQMKWCWPILNFSSLFEPILHILPSTTESRRSTPIYKGQRCLISHSVV